MTTTRWLFKPARESVYYYWSVVSCICLNVMAAGDIYESSNHIGESGKSVCCARFPFRIASTLAFYIHKKKKPTASKCHTQLQLSCPFSALSGSYGFIRGVQGDVVISNNSN